MAKFLGRYTVRVMSYIATVTSYVVLADGGDDLTKVIVAAFDRYCVSNPLHPDVFPAVRKMEAEIVAMCLRMYNNPNGAGATTSGGTESIIMSVKTHRDWAKATKGITEPEMYVSAPEELCPSKQHLQGRSYFRSCCIRQGCSIPRYQGAYRSS